MSAAETITRLLNEFFSGFGLSVYPEDCVAAGALLPYLTVLPVVPKDYAGTAAFHARLWYPSDGGKLPALQKADEIRAALADGLVLDCESGAVLLCAGEPWSQSMDNPAERYLCEYLNFEVTSFMM